MLAAKPPPLIPSIDATTNGQGVGEDCFRDLFQYLYVDAHWYARLPGGSSLKVAFLPHHFRHAFFKEPAPAQPRTVWKPERAERILWIGYTIENPCEVYRLGASRLNYFCRMGDRQAPWYLVVVDRMGEWIANFVTAYPLGHQDAVGMRRLGRLLGR